MCGQEEEQLFGQHHGGSLPLVCLFGTVHMGGEARELTAAPGVGLQAAPLGRTPFAVPDTATC